MRPPPLVGLLINNNETALPRYYASEKCEREREWQRESENEIRLHKGDAFHINAEAIAKVAAR